MRHTVALATAGGLLLAGLAAAPAPTSAAPAPAKAAAAATTLGTTGAPVECNTAVPAAVLLGAEGAGGATYTATASGVITSFSHQANPFAGQVRAIVFGPGPAGGQRSVIAKSLKQTVTPSSLNTFTTRLAVKAGQQLGLGYTAAKMGCALPGQATDKTWVMTGFDPDTNGTFVSNGVLDFGGNQAFRPNISAVVEPDVDGDLYGDLTQDACPLSPLTQGACPPPDTKITKRPKGKRANPKVKVKFTADIAGSTFQCQLDGKKWYACASPYKKKLKVGVHKLKVRAISPFGVVDAKPAKVKVEIVS